MTGMFKETIRCVELSFKSMERDASVCTTLAVPYKNPQCSANQALPLEQLTGFLKEVVSRHSIHTTNMRPV